MRLRLEPNSGIPLGQQIMRQMRLEVAAGRVKPGDRLPAARELAEDLRVNFHTVRKAYSDLEAEGLLRIERGKGTFVAAQVSRLDRPALKEVVRHHVERLAADLAGSGLKADQVVEWVVAEVHRALPPADEEVQ
jgi:GntR family transcriptional regulator